MRVIYILNDTTIFGGANKAILHLWEGMNKENITPLFIIPSDTGIAKTLRDYDVLYKVLNYRMSVYPPTKTFKDICFFIPRLIGRILLNQRAARQLAIIARDFRADIIHSNTSVNNIGYIVSQKLHIPHIWHIREYGDLDFNLHYYPSKQSQRKKYKNNLSYTICIVKDIQKYNLLDSWSNSRVIYDGVLHESQKAFLLPKDNYFLFAGRLEIGKGIEELLHAYAAYTQQIDTPIPLWIAGDTKNIEYKNKLISIVKKSNIEKYVTFLGMRKDILTLMQHTMALIVPSRAEGFGFITAEGMFSGSLVIGKNARGTKEQFDNGYALIGKDIALKYEHQNELIDYLTQISSQGIEPYISIIKSGQKVATQLYSIEKHQQTVYQFYQEILNQK